MKPEDLDHFCALLKARSGIEVSAEKAYLVASRLNQVARNAGVQDSAALLTAIRQRPGSVMVDAAIDAMTTNETFFFRDQSPFEHLRRYLLELGRKGPRRFHVWSAACSTGQEPYSIAMLWDEIAHHLPNCSLQVTASDLSPTCLAKARAGLYSAFEVQRGLPVQKLIRHFDQVEGGAWRVKPQLAATISWRRHNLLERPDGLGPFDVVFCRNVLIYFERVTRAKVIEAIAGRLAPGGGLLLGASETLLGLSDAFVASPGEPGLFLKGPSASPRPVAIAG